MPPRAFWRSDTFTRVRLELAAPRRPRRGSAPQRLAERALVAEAREVDLQRLRLEAQLARLVLDRRGVEVRLVRDRAHRGQLVADHLDALDARVRKRLEARVRVAAGVTECYELLLHGRTVDRCPASTSPARRSRTSTALRATELARAAGWEPVDPMRRDFRGADRRPRGARSSRATSPTSTRATPCSPPSPRPTRARRWRPGTPTRAASRSSSGPAAPRPIPGRCTSRRRFIRGSRMPWLRSVAHPIDAEERCAVMSILLIVLIVVIVLVLLGAFGRGRRGRV